MNYFIKMVRSTLSFTLYPYTTLFRSGYLWTTERSSDPHRTVPLLMDTPSTSMKLSHSMKKNIKKPVLITLNHLRLARSEEHTSELQSRENLVCRLLLEKKKKENQVDD